MFWYGLPYKYQKYAFSKKWMYAIFKYRVPKGVDMLTKRSTPVDQNLGSEIISPKLSVAMFIASRTHLEAQK